MHWWIGEGKGTRTRWQHQNQRTPEGMKVHRIIQATLRAPNNNPLYSPTGELSPKAVCLFLPYRFLNSHLPIPSAGRWHWNTKVLSDTNPLLRSRELDSQHWPKKPGYFAYGCGQRPLAWRWAPHHFGDWCWQIGCGLAWWYYHFPWPQ